METLAAIQRVDLSNQVSVQVARKAMDVQKDQGRVAIELLRAAAEVAKTPDRRIDTYA